MFGSQSVAGSRLSLSQQSRRKSISKDKRKSKSDKESTQDTDTNDKRRNTVHNISEPIKEVPEFVVLSR